MSDKYILRSGAIDEIKRNAGTLYTIEAESLFRKVISLLKNAPAADVVPVVRCKGCKMWREQNIFEHSDTGRIRRSGYCMCSRFTRYEDDFCSNGELQTNGGGGNDVYD